VIEEGSGNEAQKLPESTLKDGALAMLNTECPLSFKKHSFKVQTLKNLVIPSMPGNEFLLPPKI